MKTIVKYAGQAKAIMVNSITFYRLLASLLLLYFIVINDLFTFKWLLLVSFFTDAIDGFLARKFKVTTVMGSKFDSIADDLTVLMAVVGIFKFKPGFISHEKLLVTILLALYLAQTLIALIKYRKITSFHTYLAKFAAIVQGAFLILLFFLPEWPIGLFRIAAIVTILDLFEEIMIAGILDKWQTDVKGLFWIFKNQTSKHL
jgi:CDP-diacylglycerol--glycerol-3-phosphate 3-phosphatidyltransferase